MHIDSFLSYLKNEKRYSQHTLISYRNDLSAFQEFLLQTEEGLPLEEAQNLHLRNFLNQLNANGLKPSSINRKISAFKRFYKFLQKENLIQNSPAATLKSLKQPREIHPPLTESELNNWQNKLSLDKQKYHDYLSFMLIELLYQTGIRRAELIGLQTADFFKQEPAIKVLGKRKKERLIPISDELAQELKKFIAFKKQKAINSDYIFSLKNGKKLYPKFVYNLVNHYLSHITTKDKKGPHMLRHTFATHVLNNQAEINSVKELLGHSSLASTQIYIHQDIESLKKIFKQTHPREVDQ